MGAAMAQLEVGVGTPVRGQQEVRNQRGQFLAEQERKEAERQRTVRNYMTEKYGGGRPVAPSALPMPAAAASGDVGVVASEPEAEPPGGSTGGQAGAAAPSAH